MRKIKWRKERKTKIELEKIQMDWMIKRKYKREDSEKTKQGRKWWEEQGRKEEKKREEGKKYEEEKWKWGQRGEEREQEK